jgi:hypothetical protein
MPTALAASDPPVYRISRFDESTPLQGWRFESTPASSGGLTTGPGHRGMSATLAYHLPCEPNRQCTSYASAIWRAPSPPPKVHDPAVSFWIRYSPAVRIILQATDSSGNTLNFPIQPTIEHPRPGGWEFVVIPLVKWKGRLAELEFRVHAALRQPVDGSLTFDDVSLLDSAAPLQLDPNARPAAPPPAPSDLLSRMGVNIHLLNDSSALDKAREAGFRFVRMDLLWANVERGGRYRFFQYDALLRALDARQMGVLWILDYGHPDHGLGAPRTPQDIAAFARFAEAAASHFKGRNVRYEVWNEPNTSHFWEPASDPSEYAALLRAAVAAIRHADPAAKISTGGVSGIDLSFLVQAVGSGISSDLTAIGIHPYPRGGPEEIAPDFETLREWTGALGSGVEIWDTEWGYSSSNAPAEAPSNGHTEAGRKRQAILAVRELLTIWAIGLPSAVYYDLRDDGTDPANPEHNYGLLDSAGNEKPAMVAVRNLMQTAAAHKYAGMLEETAPGIHALRLEGPTGTVVIVWTDQLRGRRTIVFPTAPPVTATDIFGKPAKTKDRGGRTLLELDADTGPIYLRWASPIS